MKISFLLLLTLFCYMPPSHSLALDILGKKIREKTPLWMQEQIAKDLKGFQKQGVSQEALERTLQLFTNDPLTMRCTIHNRRIQFSYHDHGPIVFHERVRAVFYALRVLNKYYYLPNLDFIISLNDTVDYDAGALHAPVFTFAKNKNNSSLVAFPDFEAIQGYPHLIHTVVTTSVLYPFEKKISKVFWRGSTTGGTYTLSNWQHYPRSQLVLFSKEHPDLLDAKFTAVIQTPSHDQLTEVLTQHDLLGPGVSVADHISFKYLADIDGNSCTYSRLVWILFSNSLCFKQLSDNEQWYYGGLKPYVHYIPFKSDMSDFAEQFAWAEAHPDEVRAMIDHATTFAQTRLTQEDVFHYIYTLLLAYAKLQKP